MSFQKKSLILQELEQAIRKKAQQKSKTKEQMGRALQGSVERKKQALKTATKPEARLSSALRQSENSQKPPMDKAISIFGQEPAFEGSEVRAKKYNNRRLDKLLSLVQYLLSSSEKAMRFISPSNFEAEFALKLYRSDRQNLLNQLKNLTVEDIIDSQRQGEKSRPEEVNQLAEENAKLKKEIMLLQKQAQNYLKSKAQPSEARGNSRQTAKMKEILRKLIPFDSFKQLSQLLEKEARFEIMAAKSQQNSKKTTEIEIVLSSLENERSLIVQNLAKLREASKTDRSGRFTQIQGEKQQLQKQVALMKSKLADMMEANKALAELELLKKNSEIIHQRLMILARDLQLPTKKGSEQLFEQIRSAVQLQQQNQAVLAQRAEQAGKEAEILKAKLKEVDQERAELEKELRSSEEEARVEVMLREMQKFKDIIDELGEQQELSSQRIASLEKELNAKQSEIDQLKGIVEDRQDQLDAKENEKRLLQRRLSEREQHQRSLQQEMLDEAQERQSLQQALDKANQKILILQNELATIKNKSFREEEESHGQIMVEVESLRRQIDEKKEDMRKLQEELANMEGKIRQDANLLKNKVLQINRLKEEIQLLKIAGEQGEQIKQTLQVITQQRNELKEKLEDLTDDHQTLQEEFNRLKDSTNNFNQIHNQFSAQREELKLTKEQLQISQRQVEILSKRCQQSLSKITEELVTAKKEVMVLEKEKKELEGVKAILQQRLGVSEEQVECLQRKTQSLQVQVNQLQQEIRSLTLVSNEVHNSMEQSREVLSSLEDQKHELARELVTVKQQLQDSSELTRFRSRQYVSLLRQILKGLQIDPSEYEDKQSFEELLELGSQQVLQLRKKQRDQQSIKRRHGRRQEESPSQEMELKEVSVRLFNHQTIEDNVPLQQAKADLLQEQKVLQQQQEIVLLEKNKQILEEEKNKNQALEKKEQALSQQKQQQKDEQSNDKDDFIVYLPQKLSLNSVYRGQKPNKLQTLDEFQQLGNSQLGESLISQQSHQQSLQQTSQKQDSSEMNDKISEHSFKSHKKQEQHPEQDGFGQEIYMQNDSMLYSIQLNLQSSITKQDKKQRDPKNQPYSKHTMQSVALKKEKLNLDDFEEAKSVDNSFVSIRDVPEDHEGPPEDYVELPHVDLEVTIKPKLQEEDEGKGIEQFAELEPNFLSQSMLSQAKSDGEVDLDEFGELRENLGASMVSQSIDDNEKSKEELGLDEFGDLKENLGASMVSHQSEEEQEKSKQQLGLDQFGDLQEHLNNSIRSQAQSEHGLSEFGDLQDGGLGQSMVSQGQGLSEFGEVEQGLNESLISQKEEND